MHRSPLRRSVGAGAIAVSLALAGAGCAKSADVAVGASTAELDSTRTGNGDGRSAEEPTTTTTGRSSGGKVAKVQPTASATFVKESAQRNKEASNARMVFTVEAGPASQSFEMAMDVQAKKMHMVSATADEPFEMIVIGNDMYMKVGEMGELGPGIEWMKFSDPSLAESFSQSGGGMASGFEAQSMLNGMVGTDGAVEDLGTEEIDGVLTHHYKGTMSAANALSADESLTDQEKKALEDSLGSTDTPYEVWIDEDGLVRKLKMESDASEYGGTGTATVTLEIKDLGESLVIDAPPAEKVMDLMAYLGGLGQEYPGITIPDVGRPS